VPDREEPCQVCGGTGKITVPSIETKVAYHLMSNPHAGLALAPEEVAELGRVLELTPPADPGPVPPEPGAWPGGD
jgi:hypothetical protein